MDKEPSGREEKAMSQNSGDQPGREVCQCFPCLSARERADALIAAPAPPEREEGE